MDISKNIKPLVMNGLNGRMLRVLAKNPKHKREILLLCGHHSSIERMDTFIEILSECGNVTVPDLPGFGGMESFYKIKEKPTIDTYADYLASFVKLRYKRSKVVIVGVSFSVPIYIKMLQKYPALNKKVDFCVSLSGFSHHEDFKFNKYELFFIKISTFLLSKRAPSLIISNLFLKESIVKLLLKIDYMNRKKGQPRKEIDDKLKMDSKLWVINDFRTSIFTYSEMFKLNLCDKTIDNKVYHLTTEDDAFFDKNVVEQHMQIIFKNYKSLKANTRGHMPDIGAKIEDVREYIPKELLSILKKSK